MVLVLACRQLDVNFSQLAAGTIAAVLGSAQRGPFPHTGSTGVAVGVRKKAISCGEEKVDAKLTSSRRQVVAARSQRAASTWGTKVDTPRRLGKLTRRVGLKLASSRREVDAKLTSSRRQVDVKSTRGRFSAPKKPFFSIFRNPLLFFECLAKLRKHTAV